MKKLKLNGHIFSIEIILKELKLDTICKLAVEAEL